MQGAGVYRLAWPCWTDYGEGAGKLLVGGAAVLTKVQRGPELAMAGLKSRHHEQRIHENTKRHVANPLSLLQGCLEAIVGRVHVKLELARLLVAQLLGRPHLVQGNQPLHNLAFAFEIDVRDLVDSLYDLDKQRMQCVLLYQPNLDGIEQSDESLGRVDDERRISKVASLSWSRWTLFDSRGYANA